MLCEFGLANLRKLDSAPDMRVSPGFNITTQARASQSKPSKTNKPGMFNKPRAKQAEQAELAKQAMQAKQAEQARRHKRARQARQASQETGIAVYIVFLHVLLQSFAGRSGKYQCF